MSGVYENDSLQYLGHEEGRVRYNSSTKVFNWDYFIKDHLGNVRMVLTEEQKTTAYPAATMEDALASTEQALYANLPETRSSLPGGYPVDNSYSDPNLKAAKVNGNGQKIGPSITLKVMAGDKFNVKVSSWYRTVSGVPQTTSSPLTQLINAISTSVAPISAGKVTSPELSGSSFFAAEATKFLQTQNNVATKPKAYLNWILFDEQFNMVAASSGFEQVPEESMYSNTTTPKVYNHIKTNLPVHKNGYLYIYVSNETQGLDVFFDNLQVTHVAGPMVEETHYYPFGLTMAGVSSKGFDKLESKNKYNGIELSEDLGIDIYDAQLRELDPQIGRWWQIDPETESMEMWSTYSSNYDNPIRYQDPLGNAPEGCCKGFIDGLKKLGNDVYDAAVYDVKLVNTYFNPLTPAAELVTGKSVESNFTESKSRVESGTELLISLVPGGKVEGSVMRLAQKKIIRKAPSAIANEVGTGKKSNSNNSTNNNNFPSPDFIVDEKGNALPIPDGASGPKNPNKGSGMLYEGGSGGKGMSKKTTGVRVMDPNKKRKTREVNYMNKQGQTVNSKTGKTVAKSDPNAHIPY